MSPKELLYIADALGHEEFAKFKTKEVKLQDASLQNLVTQINAKHHEIFSKFMQLL